MGEAGGRKVASDYKSRRKWEAVDGTAEHAKKELERSREIKKQELE